MMSEQNEGTDKEMNYKKEPKRNSGAKKYINWNKTFIKRFQEQIWAGRRITELDWNYPVWGAERKKIEKKWTETKRPAVQQEDQHTHYGSLRGKKEKQHLKQ